MARRIRDANLETRNGRRGLAVRGKPYWRSLDKGLHMGYRKRMNGGSWVVRRYVGNEDYLESVIGLADDFQDADDVATFDYSGAMKVARAWFEAEKRKDNGLEIVSNKRYTVADAMNDYEAYYKVEGKGLVTVLSAKNAHILPVLGGIEVDRLTTKKISDWHRAIATKPAQLRMGKNDSKRKYREVDDDVETIRKRRASANRILIVLKAALNHVWKEGKVQSDTAWRKVKPFKNVCHPKIRYLSQEECVRFINACPSDFRKLVSAALFTGCRYGELVRSEAGDFNPDAGTLLIRISKNGKVRHVVLTDEAKAFFKNTVMGKKSHELLFAHAHGSAWKKSHQFRPMREVSEGANITPPIGFHVLRHTHGSMLAMKGVPMAVIAKQLGHKDTRVTERHYAHLSPSYVADTIREHFPNLGIAPESNVVSLSVVSKAVTRSKITQNLNASGA